MNEIEKIASAHLGKAGDGSIVKPYVTPDDVDPSLLVGIPRELNRVQYGILKNDSVGYDAWNAYEFSTMLENGFPLSGWVKLSYSSFSENIVESKSLKLYLNSYNMARLINKKKDIDVIEHMIASHVRMAVKGHVDVKIRLNDQLPLHKPIMGNYIQLEDICDIDNMEFTDYNQSSSILKAVRNTQVFSFGFKSNSLRSNCRVTNQPDWGDVYVYMKGQRSITPESLLKYIVSMRKENHFHEEICECIYNSIFKLISPEQLLVACLYTRRGGIDINPVRATSYKLLDNVPIVSANNFCEKTMRQ